MRPDFTFSQGAVIWVYISEIFPNRVRAKGQSIGSFTHWLMNALVSTVFPMAAAGSIQTVLFLFGIYGAPIDRSNPFLSRNTWGQP